MFAKVRNGVHKLGEERVYMNTRLQAKDWSLKYLNVCIEKGQENVSWIRYSYVTFEEQQNLRS
jgi:hypothetical protein